MPLPAQRNTPFKVITSVGLMVEVLKFGVFHKNMMEGEEVFFNYALLPLEWYIQTCNKSFEPGRILLFLRNPGLKFYQPQYFT